LLLAPVLASVLIRSTLGPATAGASSLPAGPITLDSTLKIHPLLQYEMQSDPTLSVRVIIQQVRAPGSGGLLGGGDANANNGDEQFTIIPAVVTTVKLGTLLALTKDPNVRYISSDGPVQVIPGRGNAHGLVGGVLGLAGGLLGGLLGGGGAPTGQPSATGNFSATGSRSSIDSTHLSTTYPFDTGAQSAWAGAAGTADSGAGVAVAVQDSGVDLSNPDLAGHVVAVNVNASATRSNDGFGHGTRVAGVIGGQDPTGQYVGIAPRTDIVSVKVSDDLGGAYESDVLRGLQWVSQHRSSYNIRAINLSFSTSVPQSYGVTVVTSAGNLGSATDAVWYAPGNDPLVITVGCLDENQTVAPGDDSLCPISSRGMTEDGFAKPDLLAPGRKIVSALASGTNGNPVVLAQEFPDRITADGHHIRLSGTSMSAPMVTGAVALLLARHPSLTPGQVKQVLVSTASGYPGQADSAGELNIVAALQANIPPASKQTLLPIGGTPPPAGAVTLLWDGNRWANTYWTTGHWDTAYMDTGHWDTGHWDSAAYWDSGHWDSGHWDSGHWDSGHWDSGHWDSSTYD
jgi:subtilisin family serine protease